MTACSRAPLGLLPAPFLANLASLSWRERELWIRLSQIRHDHWPHVDFGLCEGVGGKTGERQLWIRMPGLGGNISVGTLLLEISSPP